MPNPPGSPGSPDPSSLAASDEGNLLYLVWICLVATLGGLLFGYDTAVIAGAVKFLRDFFTLTDLQLGWAAASALLGCAVGAALAGICNDWLGRKKVLVVCAVLFIISAIGSALPADRNMFVLFRALGGLGVGAAALTSPMYIAEIAPSRIRGRMVSLNQLAIVSGMLAVYFVNYFIEGLGDTTWNVQTGWRWMFASEIIPAVALLLFLMPVPESPRWLIKKGRPAEALAVLRKISGERVAERDVKEIQTAVAGESESLAHLFGPGLRVALLLGIVLAVFQQVTGINVFLYYAPVIFESIAGSDTSAAMLQTVIVGSVNLSFTVIAIWSVDRLGRKPLMLVGYSGMAVSLAGLGLAAYLGRQESWVLGFILLYIACFALSVGPVTWVILSEIYPTRIRGRAMAIATVCLWLANYVVSQTFPMLDGNAWLQKTFHHAFPFWLYGALCVVAVIIVFAWVPETKGQTLETIERRWYERNKRT